MADPGPSELAMCAHADRVRGWAPEASLGTSVLRTATFVPPPSCGDYDAHPIGAQIKDPNAAIRL